MPEDLCICIGSGAAVNATKKGSTHSDALVREPSLIGKALQEQGVQASCACVADNPAVGISRGNRLREVGVAKGWRVRRGARKTR
uniref:Uncharacterized protein n=1 Tax=Trypanosoma vivax (strain Y486) TaxID=1055687 RepID=G0U7B8_TRYVY|nr:hypothetical protein, conserved in T. vivax [Trypanosoma vivax Y486]